MSVLLNRQPQAKAKPVSGTCRWVVPLGETGAGALEIRRGRQAALYEIVADPLLRERMSQAGRAWAEANSDRRVQVERLGTVYAAMTKGSPARAPTAIAFPASARKDRVAGAHPGPS